MKNVKIILVILLTIVLNSTVSFSQGTMSGDGMYLASAIKKQSKIEVLVHKFMTKQLVRKIIINSDINVDEVKMSYSGNFLYVKYGSNYIIYDVMQGKKVTSIFAASKIIFIHRSDSFLVLKNGIIYKYNCYSGKPETTFISPGGHKLTQIFLAPSNTYFAAIANNKIFIYDILKTKYKKELAGSKISFTNNTFTVFYANSQIVRVTAYNSVSLQQIRVNLSTTLLSQEASVGKLFPTRSSLSYSGNFFCLYTAKGAKVEILVYNTMTGKKIWKINNFNNTGNELYPIYWTKTDNLIAYGQQLMAGEYNIYQKLSKPLGLRIDDFTSSPFLSLDNQKNNRILSDNNHFVILQTSNGIFLRDSRIPKRKFFYENTKFLCFSNDNKYLFVLKNGVVNAIVTAQITSSLNNNKTLKFYEFDKLLSVATPEGVIKNDAPAPPGYAYFYVNNTKQIVHVDTAKLHYVLRSLKINNNDIELMVNLVDANGNDFLGATDPSWLFLWCNLLLKNPSGKVDKVDDYVVEEVYENEPTAYALVLDHSGSMGNSRVNALQSGAYSLVRNKRSQDAFMLIKYDNHAKLVSALSKNNYNTLQQLNNTGLVGFGGSTALIDAAYLSVKQLTKYPKYKKRVVILFTDGYENASFYSKYDLLLAARQANVELNIIGFGNKVNDQYLRSLADNTGGMYVHLYDTKKLKNIFTDIEYKRKHYYKVKFNTKSSGKHLAFLQLCQDQFNHDSLWVAFDNTNSKLDKRNPVLSINPMRISVTQFEKLKIPINPSLKPINNEKMNKEFGEIHFPNILFATASDKIIKSEKVGITQIVDFMTKYPYVFLEIHGHTDNQGDSKFNMDLSFRRAKAAKKLILMQGIAPGRVVVRGFGNTKPVASNDTETGKSKNRRIEFHIFKQ